MVQTTTGRAYILIASGFVLLYSIIGPSKVHANPVFARQYNTSCFTCHTSPPLLNEFGRRFQANGYQLPSTSDKIAEAARSTFPLGLVVTPMVSRSQVEDHLTGIQSEPTTSFGGIMMRFFSSASLGSHFSYYAGIPVTVAHGETSIEIETIHLLYTDALADGRGTLNFQFGKFLLFAPFTPMFLLSGEDPIVYNSMHYNPLGERTTANTLYLTDPMFGVSAFGTIYTIGQGLRWQVGMVGGNNSDVDLASARAVFGSLDQTVFLQNAPARVGAFFFSGFQDVSNSAAETSSTMAGMPGMGGGTSAALANPWRNHVTRVGFDAEITDPWTKRINLFGEFMTGLDDNIDSLGTSYEMRGGFVGMNVILLPEKLFAYGRYDWMQRLTVAEDHTAIDVGLRYHFLPNVVATGGVTITKENITQTAYQMRLDQTTTTYRAGFLFGF
ncbi:MAG: hypothetical protein Q8922_08095 [Bacteroidota bacterium]|nr:hypothetical protein [Bacteroidota bacterium]